MRLNQEQLDKFTEIFEIKAKSVILVKKNKKVTVIINSVIIFDVDENLVKNFF